MLAAAAVDVMAIEALRIEQVRRVRRKPLREDGVSGHFDSSPERIEQLMEQGRTAAVRPGGSDTAAHEPPAGMPAC